MKCLQKFKWIKLPRALICNGKGLMGYYLKLASRAAFRKGISTYCGYENPVEPGMWAGGVVGLKSILRLKSRQKALEIMDELQTLGYLTYNLETGTKKLIYRITDWVVKCSGQECQDETVYVTPGYGFLCMPRNITERLADKGLVFGEADAWLDLWCHTVFRDYGNAFSFLGPAVQFGKYGSVLTLETLGQRWHWEKTKVWRFLHKVEEDFPLYRLPGSFGCVIYNMRYPTEMEIQAPSEVDVKRILELIRFSARNTHYEASDNTRINRFVAWKTRRVMAKLLKKLKAVKLDWTERRREDALVKSVSAARISEAVTLKTRSLPAHTGHPRAEPMIRQAIAESVPVEIGFTDQDWLCIRLPILLPRKEKSSRSYIRGFLYPALEQFAASREKIRYRNCVVIFRHVYDRNRPEREYRDHDNIELNAVVDAIAMFFLVDDTPLECRHYYCSAAGDEERTEVYLVPRPEINLWLDMEDDPPGIRQMGLENGAICHQKDTEI